MRYKSPHGATVNAPTTAEINILKQRRRPFLRFPFSISLFLEPFLSLSPYFRPSRIEPLFRRRFGVIFSMASRVSFAHTGDEMTLSFEIPRLAVARVKMPVLETTLLVARGEPKGRRRRLEAPTVSSQGLHSNWISMKGAAQKLAVTTATPLIHKSGTCITRLHDHGCTRV